LSEWSEWSEEALRRAALAALGPHADERVRDALARARVTIFAGAARWAGSSGPVEAHRVVLGLDARSLGRLRAAPAVADALCAAFAAAAATHPGEVLLDLALRWNPHAGPSAAGYRNAPPAAAQASLREALVDYLEARGEDAVAGSVGDVTTHATGGTEVTLRANSPSPDAGVRATLTSAVRDLLADPEGWVRVR
jgi:hypothetical protein